MPAITYQITIKNRTTMNIKSITCLGGVICGLAMGLASASASLSFSSAGAPMTIPDGSSVGITSVINVSGAGNILASGDNVSVTLNVSGGNNGDLFAYLSFNGTLVTLLNRPGVTTGNPLGYTDSGFNNVTLSGGNSVNVNSYGGGGVPANITFNPSAGSTAFQAFNGMSANGNWTLFFADLSGGDKNNTSVLNSWSLEITAVPEPVNVALAVFGTVMVLIAAVRRRNIRGWFGARARR